MGSLKKQHGFTLLELLVTATLIAVLTVIGIVSYASVNKRSRDVKRKSDLEQVRSALEMFRSDGTEYPGHDTNASLTDGQFVNSSLLSTNLVSTYIPAIPDDPDPALNYYYQAIPTNGVYSTYCICAKLETLAAPQSTCTIALPNNGNCNYGLKNP